MAQILSASIYGFDNGYNSYDWNANMGVTRGFPTQGITIEQLRQPTTYSGVVCNSIITVLATGLEVNSTKYYTPTAVGTLITAANA